MKLESKIAIIITKFFVSFPNKLGIPAFKIFFCFSFRLTIRRIIRIVRMAGIQKKITLSLSPSLATYFHLYLKMPESPRLSLVSEKSVRPETPLRESSSYDAINIDPNKHKRWPPGVLGPW